MNLNVHARHPDRNPVAKDPRGDLTACRARRLGSARRCGFWLRSWDPGRIPSTLDPDLVVGEEDALAGVDPRHVAGDAIAGRFGGAGEGGPWSFLVQG